MKKRRVFLLNKIALALLLLLVVSLWAWLSVHFAQTLIFRIYGSSVGFGFLLGLSYFAVALWRKRQRVRQNVLNKINPYIAGPPIDNPDLFFGRVDFIDKILQGLPRNHIALQGPRRSGKSSLLHQLAQRLRTMTDPTYYFVPVLFDCHQTSEAAFFHDAMAALLETLRESAPTLTLPELTYRPRQVDYTNLDFSHDLALILAALSQIYPQEVRIILLLDEGDALNEYDRITQRKIRSLVSQHRAIKLLWAGTNIVTVASDPTSPWYNILLRRPLPPLSTADARQLITRPAAPLGYTYQPAAVQLILDRAEGQPYIIQYLCYHAVETMLAAQRSEIIAGDVAQAIAALEAETSTQDPTSVVYQTQPRPQAGLSLAETDEPYQPTPKDD
jgi:hypothetical protein